MKEKIYPIDSISMKEEIQEEIHPIDSK